MNGGLLAIERSFSRCVSRRRDPLSTEGARLFGGRFNPVGASALYLAGSQESGVEAILFPSRAEPGVANL